MLEMLEVLDYFKDVTEKIPTVAELKDHLQDEEYLTGLCQMIGSPLFSILTLRQEKTKEHVFGHLARILSEEQHIEKSLFLQYIIMYNLIKHSNIKYGSSSSQYRAILRPEFKPKSDNNTDIVADKAKLDELTNKLEGYERLIYNLTIGIFLKQKQLSLYLRQYSGSARKELINYAHKLIHSEEEIKHDNEADNLLTIDKDIFYRLIHDIRANTKSLNAAFNLFFEVLQNIAAIDPSISNINRYIDDWFNTPKLTPFNTSLNPFH